MTTTEAVESISSCFVIGPIGDEHAPQDSDERKIYETALETWERVILAACMSKGLTPIRADMIHRPGEIPEQVLRLLKTSALVIADLTGANPNVMYELGFRHAMGKASIQVGEFGKLPFDVGTIRTIRFTRTPMGLVDARRRLEEAIDATIHGGYDPVTATRIAAESVEQSTAPVIVPIETNPEETSDDEMGTLELLAQMEETLPSLAAHLGTATKIQQEITGILSAGTQDIAASDKKGGGFVARLAVSKRIADSLNQPTTQLEEVADEFERAMLRVRPGVEYIIEELKRDPQQLQQASEFVTAVLSAAGETETAVTGIRTFADATRTMGKQSKPLAGIGRRLGDAAMHIGDQMMVFQSWAQALRQLGDPSS